MIDLKLVFKKFRDISVYLFNGAFFLFSIKIIDDFFNCGVISKHIKFCLDNVFILSIFSYVIGRIILSLFFLRHIFSCNKKSKNDENKKLEKEAIILNKNPEIYFEFVERYNNNYLFFECLSYALFSIFIFLIISIVLSEKDIDKRLYISSSALLFFAMIYSVYKNHCSAFDEFEDRIEKLSINNQNES